LRGAWRGASSPRGCEDPPRLHRTPVRAGRQIDLVTGDGQLELRTQGPRHRPHLEGSHPDPPRANRVRASRPSSDFDAARIHLGTPGEQRLWTCLPPVRCNLGLPIGAVRRYRVQTVPGAPTSWDGWHDNRAARWPPSGSGPRPGRRCTGRTASRRRDRREVSPPRPRHVCHLGPAGARTRSGREERASDTTRA